MTSAIPPAAVPGPDGEPSWEQTDDRQPDPFGDPTDVEGERDPDQDTAERAKDDPRAD